MNAPAQDPAIDFVPATASDADALATLRVEAMRESLQRVGRFDEARARARLLDAFTPGATLKIVEGDAVAGFVVLRRDAQGLLLDHLYIRPSHQNLGIGGAVLRRVFAEADAQGLEVRVGALRESDANRFYVRHGFALVRQAEFDNHYVRRPRGAG